MEILTPEGPRHFPTYGDLAQFLVDTNHVESVGELEVDRLDLLADIAIHWVRRGQLACRYARRLAKQLERNSWLPVVWPQQPGPSMGYSLEPILRAAHDSTEAATLIFSGIKSPQDVARLVACLCEHADWRWERVPWEEDDDPGRVLVGLKWRLPTGQDSWVLGFAPCDSMPTTRRISGAPFTVLGMRHRWPPSNDHHDFGDRNRDCVHLANMPLMLDTDEQIEDFRLKTRQEKGYFLAGENPGAARARVTFSLPIEVAALLPEPE